MDLVPVSSDETESPGFHWVGFWLELDLAVVVLVQDISIIASLVSGLVWDFVVIPIDHSHEHAFELKSLGEIVESNSSDLNSGIALDSIKNSHVSLTLFVDFVVLVVASGPGVWSKSSKLTGQIVENIQSWELISDLLGAS